MIRYRITWAQLRKEIDQESRTWRARAQTETARLSGLGHFESGGPSWSEIKGAYMRLQHEKCIYCERKLGSEKYGKIECDVEHFRPKNAVKAWPGARVLRDLNLRSYPFPTGGAGLPEGYYLLAYAPWNYAIACKTCNTPLKSNYFPISSARRQRASAEVREYEEEKPLLVYPLGRRGPDPEKLIRFEGVMAVPAHRSGYRHQMAMTMIDFFRLNQREELLQGRADIIVSIRAAMGSWSDDPDFARRRLQLLAGPQSAHTSCARSYIETYQRDPRQAKKIASSALAYLESLR